MRFNWF